MSSRRSKPSNDDSMVEATAPLKKSSSGDSGRGQVSPNSRRSLEKDPLLKKSLLKRATERMNDSRIKHAANIKSHHHHSKHAKDEQNEHTPSPVSSDGGVGRPPLRRMSSAPATSPPTNSYFRREKSNTTIPRKPRPAQRENAPAPWKPSFAKTLSQTPVEMQEPWESTNASIPPDQASVASNADEDFSPFHTHTATAVPSATPSIHHGVDLRDRLPREAAPGQEIGLHLLRTKSFSDFESTRCELRDRSCWWPRHLSFSIAADAVLVWEDITWSAADEQDFSRSSSTLAQQLAHEKSLAEIAKRIRTRIAALRGEVGVWVEDAITDVEELDERSGAGIDELEGLYHGRMDEFSSVREDSRALLGDERGELTEVVTDIEVLQAKLEYELEGLRFKVEEVEAGVGDFETQVRMMEERVRELEEGAGQRERWSGWFARVFGGLRKPAVRDAQR